MAKSRSKRSTAKSKKVQAFRRRATAATAAPTFPEAASTVAEVVVEHVPEPVSEPPPRPAPTVEEIRALAYKIYLGRRGDAGRPDHDWLEAERMLRTG